MFLLINRRYYTITLVLRNKHITTKPHIIIIIFFLLGLVKWLPLHLMQLSNGIVKSGTVKSRYMLDGVLLFYPDNPTK